MIDKRSLGQSARREAKNTGGVRGVLSKTVLFDMQIDVVDRRQATRVIQAWFREEVARARIVVTPNVDHVVRFQSDQSFRDAYRAASLTVVDGMPLVWASRWLGTTLPERVNGCDLVEDLLSESSASRERDLTVFLLGAGPGVAERAGERMMRRWSGVRVVGTSSPPFGFENEPDTTAAIIERINGVSPDLVIVGLGAPKQEVWSAVNAGALQAKVIMCVGATIDFLAGEKRRCPPWMRRAGLEWAYRLVQEPRRLWRRYAVDAVLFLPLAARAWFRHRRPRSSP